MKLIIGLIGAKQAGKTTTYNTIAAMEDVQEITLARKLKDVCAKITEIDREAFDAPDLKEVPFSVPVFLTAPMITSMFMAYGIAPDYDTEIRQHIGMVLHTPRQIAQYVGTEVLRAVEPDIHCRSAIEEITADIGVVTDMRFPNEFDYFAKKDTRFIPIYIKSTAAEIEAGRDSHVSESYLQELAKKAMITITNDKDLISFQNSVKIWFRNIMGGNL